MRETAEKGPVASFELVSCRARSVGSCQNLCADLCRVCNSFVSMYLRASVAILFKEALFDLTELFFDAGINHSAFGLDQTAATGYQRIFD